MKAKRKTSWQKWIEIFIVCFPLIIGLVLGLTVEKGTDLFSKRGIVFGTSMISFAVVCWLGVLTFDFFKEFPLLNSKSKPKKAIHIILYILQILVGAAYVFLTYRYLSIGCHVAELEALEDAARLSGASDYHDLTLEVRAARETLLHAKFGVTACRLVFLCGYYIIPNVGNEKAKSSSDEEENDEEM